MTSALKDENVTTVLFVTAWVRASGMALLAPGLKSLQDRGGTSRLFFGVDLAGTSRQGVDLALDHFDDAYVVHDPTGRTFHPKIYLAFGEHVGYALIGSNNLTAGGLWHNYESAVIATFDPRRESGVLDGVCGYAQRLLTDTAICKKVTDRVRAQLALGGWFADEERDRWRGNEDRPAERAQKKGAGPPLFTPSAIEKRGRPAPSAEDTSGPKPSKRTRRRLAVAPDSWWKQLGPGNAQRPRSGNPTGHVTLTDVPRDQDRNTFFRKTFFGSETWRRHHVDGKRTELAEIRAEVEIGESDLGDHVLEVMYDPGRRERGRATTVLRWGGPLLRALDETDVTDWYLLIERADLGIYRIRITSKRPG